MKISTKLQRGIWVTTVLVITVGVTLFFSSLSVDRAIVKNKIAFEIVVAKTQLRFLLMEYLQNHDARSKAQWIQRHHSLTSLLKTEAFKGTVGESTLDEVRQMHQHQFVSFAALVQIYAMKGGTITEAALSQAKEAQLSREMLQTSADIVNGAIRLSRATDHELESVQRQSSRIVMGLVLMLAATVMTVMVMIFRTVLAPIGRLQKGVASVTAGQLDFRINLVSEDEFGELSNAFDHMAEHLLQARGALEQEAAHLDAANKELDAFAYSISHDLRAPLRAIDGFSRKVIMGYADKLDDEGRRQLQVIRDNAQNMGRLIDDLLAFSRMGRREIQMQVVDMGSMVSSILTELRGVEAERTIETDVKSLPNAYGDTAMLRQVWTNLLGNAVKFTRGRTPAQIEIGGRIEGPEVVFWVKDNGAGFDMRFANKLFGVFQRLHRQDEFEGTGVGLAIAQRILYRHNGRIWGEGVPNVGATFWFALPCVQPNSQATGVNPS